MSKSAKNSEAKITKDAILRVAQLSNLKVTQEELEKYSKELSEVINYNMGHLEEINTKGVEPTAHSTGAKSVIRKDIPEPGLSVDKVSGNAKSKYNNLFKVDHVFGEE